MSYNLYGARKKLIPAPDYLFEWILGISGILVMCSWIGIGVWKFSDSSVGTVLVYLGMAIGFILIFSGLSGAIGLGDYTDGKSDVWRDQVTEEIKNTDCENMKALSMEYKNSKMDGFTAGQITEIHSNR